MAKKYKKEARIRRAKERQADFDGLSQAEKAERKAQNKARYNARRVYPEIYQKKAE